MRACLIALLDLTCSSEATTPSTRTQTAVSAAQSRPAETRSSNDFDVLIRNGTVIDGTGKPGIRADVGIRGDSIAQIGDLHEKTATTTLDATNSVVTPGFI